jgi:ATP-dependent Clp protease protease subunit
MANIFKEDRVIVFSDGVNPQTCGNCIHFLTSIIEKDNEQDKTVKNFQRKPIKIIINSPGGEVPTMWGLIDLIESSKTPIYTYCLGEAASAAGLIFMAGHKRYIGKHSQIMIHTLSHSVSGKIEILNRVVERDNKLQKELEQFILSKTKITSALLNQVSKEMRDWFLDAEEAITLGVADKIITTWEEE